MDFNQRADEFITGIRKEHRKRMAEIELRIRELTPRTVKLIEIHGSQYINIYDHAPQYGCFTSDNWITINIEYEDLVKTKSFALREYNRLIADFERSAFADDSFEPYDGLFSPYSIVLRDQFGDVVTCFRNDIWLDTCDLPHENDWPALLEESESLNRKASYESGWDNFSTAECLRKRAQNIVYRVQTAKNLSRLFR